jgi:hypothetical protein
MQKSIRRGLACLVALAVCTGGAALASSHTEKKAAEEKPAQQGGMPPMSPEMQAEMAAWMKVGTPGKEHQELAAMAGTWKATGKSFMGPEPTTFEATAKREVMLDGRVVAEHFTGSMMGMAFEGHGMLGYDNASKRYWSTWNDNMSTGVLVSYGQWDESQKGLAFDGQMTDPAGKALKTRIVIHQTSPTQQHFEYWEERGGQMTKTMEMELVKQ